MAFISSKLHFLPKLQVKSLSRNPLILGASTNYCRRHEFSQVANQHKENLKDNNLLKNKDVNLIWKRFESMKVRTVPRFNVEVPSENQKLPFLEKVPHPIMGLKQRKMSKMLHLIRGEEEIHTDFLYGQYGIVAQNGGFLRHGHLEMIRLGIHNRINTKNSFAIWRIPAPWKTHFKKGIGKRMGGGKGNISYYTTPVKSKRVIIEVAGKCTFEEVKRLLEIIADKLPFDATVMTQQMIEEQRIEDKRLEDENLNPYTFKYLLQNNMMGCKVWAKQDIDMKYFGRCI